MLTNLRSKSRRNETTMKTMPAPKRRTVENMETSR